jgi:hypothetical protein
MDEKLLVSRFTQHDHGVHVVIAAQTSSMMITI